jgi:hypothetical protein
MQVGDMRGERERGRERAVVRGRMGDSAINCVRRDGIQRLSPQGPSATPVVLR